MYRNVSMNLGSAILVKALTVLLIMFGCNSVQTIEDSDSVSDILFLDTKNIICSKRNGEIAFSNDGGDTWNTVSKCDLDNLTIDDKGKIWGIKSWVGIHEPSYSRLYYSEDRGMTWTEHTFNVNKFFPLRIFSEPSQKLRVLTFSNQVFELNGTDVSADWSKITDVDTSNLNRLTGFYQERKLQELKSKFDISDLSDCLDILEINDTVYLAGGGVDGHAYFSVFYGNRHKYRFEMDGMQATGLKMDKNNRVWVLGDAGAFVWFENVLKKRI